MISGKALGFIQTKTLGLFLVYLTTLFSDSDYIATNETVICEWWVRKDLEEAVVAYFKVLLGHFPGGTVGNHEKSVSIAGLRAEIQTRYLPNTKEDC
jgi:hypothetical protein